MKKSIYLLLLIKNISKMIKKMDIIEFGNIIPQFVLENKGKNSNLNNIRGYVIEPTYFQPPSVSQLLKIMFFFPSFLLGNLELEKKKLPIV